jgi:uncharacterized lipoprotein YmbA
MDMYFRRLTVFVFVTVLLVGAGCVRSAPSTFYLLNPVKPANEVSQKNSMEQTVIIAVGPLRIPDYLDRPQIVTRSGKNKLKLAEFERWAGSLDQDISRVLVENISGLLPEGSPYVMRWYPSKQIDIAPLLRVEVNIIRFDGVLGKSVMIRALWTIFDKDGKMLLQKESAIGENVDGGGYDSLVKAMSNALGVLSRDIANAITSLKEINISGRS